MHAKKKLQEVAEQNKMTGRNRKSWKFHSEIPACVGKINPAVTNDTSSTRKL